MKVRNARIVLLYITYISVLTLPVDLGLSRATVELSSPGHGPDDARLFQECEFVIRKDNTIARSQSGLMRPM